MPELTVEEFERRVDTTGARRESAGLPFKRSLEDLDRDILVRDGRRNLKMFAVKMIKMYEDGDRIDYEDFCDMLNCERANLRSILGGLKKHLESKGYTIRCLRSDECYIFRKLIK